VKSRNKTTWHKWNIASLYYKAPLIWGLLIWGFWTCFLSTVKPAKISGEEIFPKRPAGASLSFGSYYERILKLPEARRGALGAIQFFFCDPQQLSPRATLGITSPLLPLLFHVIPLLLDIRDLLIWIHYDEEFDFHRWAELIQRLPTLTSIWFSIIIHQRITYQRVGPGAICTAL